MTRTGSHCVTEAGRERRRILVRGRVQGVGFRPFVYRNALALGLSGWVRNTAQGVVIEAEGAPEKISRLLERLRDAPPANSSVDAVETREMAATGESVFSALVSETGGRPSAEIPPDLAICDDCLRELFDRGDRRYLYPFISCAHCGPRFSIIEGMPYDRARTSMRRFAMCADCSAEYRDPADRRFHAEPIACPACGPRLAFRDGRGRELAQEGQALIDAADAIRAGRIVALKGVGGFHLLVDARDEAAVRRLRERKRRPEKPFAVMFASLADVARHCRVSDREAELASGAARPIVLLRRRRQWLASAVAPASPWLGALLPYAPLHHLLMRELGFPIVATSGNSSDEPIVTDEGEALERLRDVADAFLVHDRPIVRAVDDSVARIVAGRELVLRRARGFAPASIRVDGVAEGIVALGGHLKATVAVTSKDAVRLSQHIGDLDDAAIRAAHGRVLADLRTLQGATARLAARDLHPDYASGAAAEAMGLPAMDVPHHLAHVVACMAENGIAPPALGVAFDGAGHGADGTIWGGEFIHVGDGQWRRVAHLRGFRLPGGAAAMREPRRAAIGMLYEVFGERAFAFVDLPPVASFSGSERAILATMLARGVNAPWTTSAGRLFDAFAALTGLRQRASYEGQAAAELEGAAAERAARAAYPFALTKAAAGELILDWAPALEAALAHLREGAPPGLVSASLHRGLAQAIAGVAVRLAQRRVALSGGCFQNALLTEETIDALRAAGCEPLWHRLVPPNDGGLALGQAVWAAWRERARERPGEASCV